jgi:hypothetical protein
MRGVQPSPKETVTGPWWISAFWYRHNDARSGAMSERRNKGTPSTFKGLPHFLQHQINSDAGKDERHTAHWNEATKIAFGKSISVYWM